MPSCRGALRERRVSNACRLTPTRRPPPLFAGSAGRYISVKVLCATALPATPQDPRLTQGTRHGFREALRPPQRISPVGADACGPRREPADHARASPQGPARRQRGARRGADLARRRQRQDGAGADRSRARQAPQSVGLGRGPAAYGGGARPRARPGRADGDQGRRQLRHGRARAPGAAR